MTGDSFEIWSGEKFDGEFTRHNIEPRRFAKEIVRMPESTLSLWRSGKKKPNKKYARRAQHALEVANQIAAGSEIPPNFNDTRWFREQIRKASGGRPPKPIAQESGSAYLLEFCLHTRIAPEEFCDRTTLVEKVSRADVVSLPAQRWIRAWSVAFAHELNGKLFDEFAAAFPSRDAALATLQRGAYKRLVVEVGAAKIREYLHAMVLTGELVSAPRDIEEN